jgi:3-phenylpropionate/cinnamic acid dioxygenase small subunit
MDDNVVCEGRALPLPRSRLLDERRLHERLEVLTDDIRYWMAGRTQPLSEVEQGDCDPRSLSALSRTM